MSSSEEAKRAGAEGPKATNVLGQKRGMPFCPVKMAVGGFLIASTIGYLTLYSKKKPEASAMDVAKVTAGVASNRDVHPRN